MDLTHLSQLLRKRWLTIALLTLACVLAAGAVSYAMTPRFTASTRMHFAVQGGESVADLAQGSTFTEKQMGSYVEAARSALVLDPVIKELELGVDGRDLARTIDVTVPEGTMVLEIAATHVDAQTAADIANGVADELAAATAVLSPARADGTESVVATMLTPAYLPEQPSSPKVAANLTLGAVLGMLLGLGVAAVRHALDTKVRDGSDVGALTDIPVVGAIPFEPGRAGRPVYMHDAPSSARAEALRRLRTNLKFVSRGGQVGSILVTSSVPGEGKTTTAINLAVALADAGNRVLLIDADLRRPSIADYLGMEGGAGLTTVLIGSAGLPDVVQPWRGTSLDVLPSGEVPPNPTDLLGSPEMVTLLAEAAVTYDAVVLDSPPLLPVTDAAVLSTLTSGTLLLAGSDRITRAQLRESLETVGLLESRVLGVVLNKVAARDRGYGSYASLPARQGPRRQAVAGASRKVESRSA
jgi:polysaccharide biosynthesis transport protein